MVRGFDCVNGTRMPDENQAWRGPRSKVPVRESWPEGVYLPEVIKRDHDKEGVIVEGDTEALEGFEMERAIVTRPNDQSSVPSFRGEARDVRRVYCSAVDFGALQCFVEGRSNPTHRRGCATSPRCLLPI